MCCQERNCCSGNENGGWIESRLREAYEKGYEAGKIVGFRAGKAEGLEEGKASCEDRCGCCGCCGCCRNSCC